MDTIPINSGEIPYQHQCVEIKLTISRYHCAVLSKLLANAFDWQDDRTWETVWNTVNDASIGITGKTLVDNGAYPFRLH